jgi:hypothetical protein
MKRCLHSGGAAEIETRGILIPQEMCVGAFEQRPGSRVGVAEATHALPIEQPPVRRRPLRGKPPDPSFNRAAPPFGHVRTATDKIRLVRSVTSWAISNCSIASST